MVENFNSEEYKKIVAKYAQFDSILKNFDKAQYDPGVRQGLGLEVMRDPQAYVNSGSDSVFIGAQSARKSSAGHFQTETRENLETILSDVSGKLGDNGLIQYTAQNVPVYEPEKNARFKDETEKHKKATEAIRAFESKDYDAMLRALIEYIPEHENAIRYHLVNNKENFRGIFQRGILNSRIGDFVKLFTIENKDKPEEPKFNSAKVKDYAKYTLNGMEDAEQFADAILPLAIQTYLQSEENSEE